MAIPHWMRKHNQIGVDMFKSNWNTLYFKNFIFGRFDNVAIIYYTSSLEDRNFILYSL